MRINSLEKFLAKVGAGKTAYGTVVNLNNAFVSEMAAYCGFDFI